jgi:MscS family membrane protein
MNDFFEQIILDNTVREYCVVFGVILFTLILKRLISKYLAGLLFKVVNRIWRDVDKRSFTGLVIKPLGFFLLILVAIIALHKLTFPEALNADVYRFTVKQFFHCSGTIILIISFIGLLLRVIDFVALILEKKADLTPDQTDNQLIIFFKDFFKVILIIIGIVLVLKYAFGLHVGSLVTGLSIVGAAIALALRESLENLIASFIIFFDKPFVIGDLVKVQNINGTVEKIGLRSTRIRTDQKTTVAVPNKQMVDSIVDNLSLRTQRRADIKLELNIQTSSEKISAVLSGVKKILDRNDIENFHIHLSDITANSAIITGDYYTAPLTIQAFNEIKESVNLQILKLLEGLAVETSGANTDLRISGNLK